MIIYRNGFYLYDTGKQESKMEKLRSTLAQLKYKHQVILWMSKNVPFNNHLYVPEIHPITGMEFCECEDEGHIFKVCSDYLTYMLCKILLLIYTSRSISYLYFSA